MTPAEILATFRLTKLAIDDEITRPLRERLFERFDPDAGSKIGYLFTCPWCVSVWAAAGIVAGRSLAPRTTRALVDILALSATSGLLELAQSKIE